MKEPKEIAVEHFKSGLACSQAVFASHAPNLGLPLETALKIAAPFGGGMGRLGEVCGAVSGALMVIGLKVGQTSGEDKAGKELTYSLVQKFAAQFKERHGSLLCRELLGCQLGTPEAQQILKENGRLANLCPLLVADAAEIAGEIID